MVQRLSESPGGPEYFVPIVTEYFALKLLLKCIIIIIIIIIL
jgi:hypothetical protein